NFTVSPVVCKSNSSTQASKVGKPQMLVRSLSPGALYAVVIPVEILGPIAFVVAPEARIIPLSNPKSELVPSKDPQAPSEQFNVMFEIVTPLPTIDCASSSAVATVPTINCASTNFKKREKV